MFIVDKVVGKHEYITVAIGINANGTVKQIEIMEYNESYGYEVRNAAWRAQFVGKSASSPLQLNVDIKNISGATLSSKHITDGVKRILQKYASSLKEPMMRRARPLLGTLVEITAEGSADIPCRGNRGGIRIDRARAATDELSRSEERCFAHQ